MKALSLCVVLAALVASEPAFALSKCVARDGTVTYTDTNCHRYGREKKLKLRIAPSYSSAQVQAANTTYASVMGAERTRREEQSQRENAQADAELALARAQSVERAKEKSKLNITPLPPMQADQGTYLVLSNEPSRRR